MFEKPFNYEERAQAARTAQRELLQFFDRSLREKGLDRTKRSAEYKRLLAKAWASLEAAYPPGFWEDVEQLRQGNPLALDTVIRFLEADPRFYRSGYVKQKLIRVVKRVPLTPEQMRRLQWVILQMVDKGYCREFREYCRLALKLDTPEFRSLLLSRLNHSNQDIKRRAGWIFDYLQKHTEKPAK